MALRQQDPDAAERAEVALLVALLGAQFGPAQADLAKDTIFLQASDCVRRWVLCVVLTAARHQSDESKLGAVCSCVMMLFEYNRAELGR